MCSHIGPTKYTNSDIDTRPDDIGNDTTPDTDADSHTDTHISTYNTATTTTTAAKFVIGSVALATALTGMATRYWTCTV